MFSAVERRAAIEQRKKGNGGVQGGMHAVEAQSNPWCRRLSVLGEHVEVPARVYLNILPVEGYTYTGGGGRIDRLVNNGQR